MDITRAFRATEFTEFSKLTLSGVAATARGDDAQRMQVLDRHTDPSYRASRKRPCPALARGERRYISR
eukprot:9134251-Pyramimonas_sp.AAC.1